MIFFVIFEDKSKSTVSTADSDRLIFYVNDISHSAIFLQNSFTISCKWTGYSLEGNWWSCAHELQQEHGSTDKHAGDKPLHLQLRSLEAVYILCIVIWDVKTAMPTHDTRAYTLNLCAGSAAPLEDSTRA